MEPVTGAATVDANGNFTAQSAGVVRLIATTVNGRTASCLVTVSYTHLDVYKRQGLPRAQPQRPHVGAEDVALGVKGAVEQHVHGFLHARSSLAAFLVDISTVDMSIITGRRHLSRLRSAVAEK